jgi:hypothetical protein
MQLSEQQKSEIRFAIVTSITLCVCAYVTLAMFFDFETTYLYGTWFSVVIFFLCSMYILAHKNIWFTFVAEGTAKAVVRGGRFVRFLMNCDDETCLAIKQTQDKTTRMIHWFGARTGFYYVGPYPFQTIYEFPLTKIRLKKGHENEPNIRKKLEIDTNEMTDHFRINPERIILLENVDFKDNTRVDIILQVVVQVVDLYYIFFKLGPNKAMSVLESAVINYALYSYRKLDYTQIGAAELTVDELNISTTGSPIDLPKDSGFQSKTILMIDFSVTPEAAAIQAALEKDRIAKEEKKAAITRAEGLRDAKKIITDGDVYAIVEISNAEAGRNRVMLEQMIAGGITQTQAAESLKIELKHKHMENVTVWSEAGAPMGMNINHIPEKHQLAALPPDQPLEPAAPIVPLIIPAAPQQTQNRPPRQPNQGKKGGNRRT